MQNEQIKSKGSRRGFLAVIAVMVILIPATIGISWYLGDRKYYIASVLIMIYSMIPFFGSFERRKPQARELVTLAVMCAIAVASRAIFIAVPHFKPMGANFGIIPPLETHIRDKRERYAALAARALTALADNIKTEEM